MKLVLLLSWAAIAAMHAQEFTRGVGQYPGDPKEYAGPSLHPDATYRNLALNRAAYQSSSYDFNLTSQLITDGIRETTKPRWVAVSTSDKGLLPRHERELLFDHNWVTNVSLNGKHAWIVIEIGGDPPEIDRVDVDASVRAAAPDNQNWTCTLSGSTEGTTWRELARQDGLARPGGELKTSLPTAGGPARYRFYRFDFWNGRPLLWQIAELSFYRSNRRVELAGPYHFSSAWKSAGAGEEWVYVDLGASSSVDRVSLYWIESPAAGSLEISGDATNWTALQNLPAAAPVHEIRLAKPVAARYVRVRMTSPVQAGGYVLSELEVYGRGGLVPGPKAAPDPSTDGGLALTGGGWRLQRDSLVQAGGPALSLPGFSDRNWLPATVPGTVLASYLNAGAIPNPDFGDNQLLISDSFFYAAFWYRNEFVLPSVAPGKHVWLNFDGVNWKADIYLNGGKVGRLEGAFARGQFDVTALLHQGGRNALAVRIEKNATPGSAKEKTFDSPGANGGAPGGDNPTYHASIGWDWIPTIRGRNTGIWDSVSLTVTGPVRLESPYVSTTLPLPDTSRADVTVQVALRNLESTPVTGMVAGRFGETTFQQPVTVGASQTLLVTVPPLHLANPKLWWPNGYGDPNLYPVELRFETTAGVISDSRAFSAGVRQFTYSEDGGALKMWINGRRFVARGGNWGFGESMLRYRTREYDTAVRYHRDMNFTMIRNWVGQIGEDAFYDACDRYGIVVWQDFWLANPWDGPDPDDDGMFLNNVSSLLRRIRNHPSIGLYCGRNEGYPPGTIEAGIRKELAALHPDSHYIPSSADDVVSGHGPYQAMPLQFYFTERATTQLHTELGMPNIVSLDSLRAMLPEADLWPQGRMWGVHDFSLHGAQGGESFIRQIDHSYGGATNVADWVGLAQFVNYEGYRAMFEAQSRHRMGLLIWMSHPAWPSLVWQTYDYFFEPTAAYFGSKKGSEPLHIQWNPVSGNVEVVNYSAGAQTGLDAHAEVLNLSGASEWQKTVTIDSAEDSVADCFPMEYPAAVTPVHFIRLKLTRGGQPVSDNLYWRGVEEGNYRALRDLPKVRIDAATVVESRDRRWWLTTELTNGSTSPALMVRLKAVRERTGDRILPALYSDNYIQLMPGERRTITTQLNDADTRGEQPRIVVEGFNVTPNAY